MKELIVNADVANLEEVQAFIDAELEEHDCLPKVQVQIEIAVEEIFVNIASYAYSPETGNALIRIEILDEPSRARLTFIDEGTPYDPLAKEDPDVTLSAEERKIGGLGIFMVKKSMDKMSYERKDGKNILTIEKNL